MVKPKPKYSRSSRKQPPREFDKVVVTRAGRLQEWSQGELRLYHSCRFHWSVESNQTITLVLVLVLLRFEIGWVV